MLKKAGLDMEPVPLVAHYEDSHCGRKKKKQKLMFPHKGSIIITAHKRDDFVCRSLDDSDLRPASTRSSSRHAAASSTDTVQHHVGEGLVISKQRPPKGTYVTTSAAELLIRR